MFILYYIFFFYGFYFRANITRACCSVFSTFGLRFATLRRLGLTSFSMNPLCGLPFVFAVLLIINIFHASYSYSMYFNIHFSIDKLIRFFDFVSVPMSNNQNKQNVSAVENQDQLSTQVTFILLN